MSDSFDDDDADLTGDQPDYEKDLASGSKAKKNSTIHRRIDDILEEKRLRKLLDETDDWTL